MRILFVDSDEIFLHGFCHVLAAEWDVTPVLLPSIMRFDQSGERWDVRVVGVSARYAGSVLDFLSRHTCSSDPTMAIVSPDALHLLPELASRGFAGLVLRSAPVPVLCSAVADVAAGRAFVDRDLVDILYRRVHSLWDRWGLTAQQARLASAYVEAGSRRLVAQEIGVSENTVKYHLREIYRKTSTSSLDGLRQLVEGGRSLVAPPVHRPETTPPEGVPASPTAVIISTARTGPPPRRGSGIPDGRA